MSPKGKYPLSFQYYLGWVSAFLLAPLMYLLIRLVGYRIRNVGKIRKYCLERFKAHRGPWIICANHLTMIDSIILVYALAPFYYFPINYRLLPWNLPERANFRKNTLLTVLTYLTKCIPVSRGGSRKDAKAVLDKCLYLLGKNQPVLIFPEGGRTRTGRVDVENFSYGVGYFIEHCAKAKVLCLYLRGDHQDEYSNLPQWGEHFTAGAEVLEPVHTELSGLRAQRAYAEQIVKQLARMEESHFAFRSHRSGSPAESKEQMKNTAYAASVAPSPSMNRNSR
ncbi:MAG: 1-acyl-sn-glycerol-3-phosphate acyltransferase [Deltaproteobacteria bacterium]|nr:1-acyl-sn-glycerol-3-phosphate acyltransferase [Deltaproteobacteria bacterium]